MGVEILREVYVSVYERGEEREPAFDRMKQRQLIKHRVYVRNPIDTLG